MVTALVMNAVSVIYGKFNLFDFIMVVIICMTTGVIVGSWLANKRYKVYEEIIHSQMKILMKVAADKYEGEVMDETM